MQQCVHRRTSAEPEKDPQSDWNGTDIRGHSARGDAHFREVVVPLIRVSRRQVVGDVAADRDRKDERDVDPQRTIKVRIRADESLHKTVRTGDRDHGPHDPLLHVLSRDVEVLGEELHVHNGGRSCLLLPALPEDRITVIIVIVSLIQVVVDGDTRCATRRRTDCDLRKLLKLQLGCRFLQMTQIYARRRTRRSARHELAVDAAAHDWNTGVGVRMWPPSDRT